MLNERLKTTSGNKYIYRVIRNYTENSVRIPLLGGIRVKRVRVLGETRFSYIAGKRKHRINKVTLQRTDHLHGTVVQYFENLGSLAEFLWLRQGKVQDE